MGIMYILTYKGLLFREGLWFREEDGLSIIILACFETNRVTIVPVSATDGLGKVSSDKLITVYVGRDQKGRETHWLN